MSQLTDNSALITIDVSRSGDVLLDDIEAHEGRIGTVSRGRGRRELIGSIADPEEDLPRHQVREEGRRRRNQRMVREKLPDDGPERSSSLRRRGREGEEVVEIRRDTPLHPLLRSLIHHHHGGA